MAAPAAKLDVELMSPDIGAYTLSQLMELAGLSVASAFSKCFSSADPVLVFCGPGNNGGDGLVAARHLALWGYDVTVVIPKVGGKNADYFKLLMKQCSNAKVKLVEEEPSGSYLSLVTPRTNIVDAVFGFSASGPPRSPYDKIVPLLHTTPNKVLSVDIPSGWNVDEGDVNGTGFQPDVLVSLTAVKEGAKEFKGRHFVGGRFLYDDIGEKYGIAMPPYENQDQVYEITRPANNDKIVVYITAPSSEVAEEISSALVSEELAACVNITPGIKSVYKWQGAIEKDAEVLMMVKSRKHLFKDIETKVKDLHPYDTPELIVVDIKDGSREYLDWIDESVRKDRKSVV